MKILIIAEKSSVAGEIADALGGFRKEGNVYEREDLVISSAVGHLVQSTVPEADGVNGLQNLPVIPEAFSLQVIDRTKDQFNVLQRLMRRPDVGSLINACDAGREGELIFRLIVEKAGCTKPFQRMWCQSMTHDSLREAFYSARPGSEYDRLGDAAKCRSEADWLIGINGSRGLSALHRHMTGEYESMSAGRVQTPTLAIVVRHQRRIRNFVSQDFWEVVATFSAASGQYSGKWMRPEGEATEPGESRSRFADREQAQALASQCQGQPVTSVDDTINEVSKQPPLLFDLTTLQREVNLRYKFSAKKTLTIAQALYETHKATTYPRTDAKALPEDYVATAADVIRALEGTSWGQHAKQVVDGDWVRPNKRVFDNSKISDHFAIVPTGVIPSRLDQDEQLVYDLIVRRFIAAFFPNARFRDTKRDTLVAGETFHTTGRVMLESGYLSVLQDVQEENPNKTVKAGAGALCAVAEGELPTNSGLSVTMGKTEPPKGMTEAGLLGAMETAGKLVDDEELSAAMSERGLGTPATRASIIETLLSDRDGKGNPKEPYLYREKNLMLPSDKGNKLIEFLERCGCDFLVSPQMTGDWEHRLNKMEKGSYSRGTFMKEIAVMTRGMIDTLRGEAGKVPTVEAKLLSAPCPKCGGQIKAGNRVLECASSCGFKLWREIAQRMTSDEEVEALLGGQTLQNLEGFFSPTKNRKFNAGLRWSGEKVEFVFEERAPGAAPGGAPPANVIAACPCCGGQVDLKPKLAACVSCEFKVWREQFGKTFSDTQMVKLVVKGELKAINGLKSRAGNVFSADIRVDPKTGRTELVFPDRK